MDGAETDAATQGAKCMVFSGAAGRPSVDIGPYLDERCQSIKITLFTSWVMSPVSIVYNNNHRSSYIPNTEPHDSAMASVDERDERPRTTRLILKGFENWGRWSSITKATMQEKVV